MAGRSLTILRVGANATIQDRGRPGFAALGVSRSGAFDPEAAALANRLVGNDSDAAVIELVLGGMSLRTTSACVIALTGAQCSVRSDRPLAWGAPITLAAGAEVHLTTPVRGLRSWLAVRGGLDVPMTLGSRSADSLGGLGPAPLAAGDVLPIGEAGIHPIPSVDWSATPASHAQVRVEPGPRLDWFAPGAWDALRSTSWAVQPNSDRIGIRLDGPPLTRVQTDELPSEGLLPGAIQVPPDGRPIIIGPDGPVTGGYPVIGIVPVPDMSVLAQLRPGDALTLAG